MIVTVKHYMQVAHRLHLMPGKCQQIHGHSMQVELGLIGQAHEGVFEELDFGDIKKRFRNYLDDTYDHRLLLNADDPWARVLVAVEDVPVMAINRNGQTLPGLVKIQGDPTVENLAQIIADWAVHEFGLDAQVTIHETSTNSVTAGATCSE